jgi:hypothetical protein
MRDVEIELNETKGDLKYYKQMFSETLKVLEGYRMHAKAQLINVEIK